MNILKALEVTSPWLIAKNLQGSHMIVSHRETITGTLTEPHAKLIVCVPEMLEALIDDLLEFEYEQGWIPSKTQNVVEKATGKTWSEIKELIDENPR